jgi:hypothetical protein
MFALWSSPYHISIKYRDPIKRKTSHLRPTYLRWNPHETQSKSLWQKVSSHGSPTLAIILATNGTSKTAVDSNQTCIWHKIVLSFWKKTCNRTRNWFVCFPCAYYPDIPCLKMLPLHIACSNKMDILTKLLYWLHVHINYTMRESRWLVAMQCIRACT